MKKILDIFILTVFVKAVLFAQFNGGFVSGGGGGTAFADSGNFAKLNATNSFTANGAASTPVEKFVGTWFTGGSSTTTKPLMLIEPTGTTSTGWSTAGTGLGVNAASGFAGNLWDAKINGTSYGKLDATGNMTIAGSALTVSSTNYQVESIYRGTSNSTYNIYGDGNAQTSLRLYGSSHATRANNLEFLTGSTLTERMRVTASGALMLENTVTAGGTTGNQTINKMSGTVNFAGGGSTLTVTNSLCTTSSIVFATIRTNDATATIKNVVPGSGSFVITLTAAATAETSVGFFVVN